ncbi:MAG: hypothetical protein DME52_08395 [Verrucomicrobia bacterium]|nr:MAG: hypothetical protein DME52_08395 [Verrucomicrobiota bacterium]
MALFAAHLAFIAAASCARRSGERFRFLFAFLALGFFASAFCAGDFFSTRTEGLATGAAAAFLLAWPAFWGPLANVSRVAGFFFLNFSTS